MATLEQERGALVDELELIQQKIAKVDEKRAQRDLQRLLITNYHDVMCSAGEHCFIWQREGVAGFDIENTHHSKCAESYHATRARVEDVTGTLDSVSFQKIAKIIADSTSVSTLTPRH